MHRLTATLLAISLALLLLASLSSASPVPEPNSSLRVRRSSSDQRMAELQALMALTGSGGRVAHGQFDPLRIGKKKRDFSDEQRYQLLRAMLERAAAAADQQGLSQ